MATASDSSDLPALAVPDCHTATVCPAIQNSDRDLTIMPSDLLTVEFVDTYLTSKSHTSGERHLSKGYKYFHEGYLQTKRSKYIYTFYVLFMFKTPSYMLSILND